MNCIEDLPCEYSGGPRMILRPPGHGPRTLDGDAVPTDQERVQPSESVLDMHTTGNNIIQTR
jgi:hypothetical protein